MKLVTFIHNDGDSRLGALIADGRELLDLTGIHDISPSRASECLLNMQSFIEAGADAMVLALRHLEQAPAKMVRALSEVELLAPLPRPAQIRCFSVFEKHAKQSARVMMKIMAANSPDPERTLAEFESSGRFDIPPVFYERPLYYKGNRFSVTGPGSEVRWPAYSDVIDYELELAAVIGKKARDVPASEAREHIFGYSIFNDLTARDEQSREMVAPLGPAKGKDFDGGNVLGPCIVTADELPDPYALSMQARVNGSLWSEGRSDDMTHSFEQMLAYVSRSETVYPGELFMSGCVGGGSGMEQERYLSRGDRVELEIERIGTLATRII